MNKIFTKVATLSIGLAMAIGVGVAAGSGRGISDNSRPVVAVEDDEHDFSQSLSKLLNNNASIDSIIIAEQTYPVKEVIVTFGYNKNLSNPVTGVVTVGETDFGTEYFTGNGGGTVSFTGSPTIGQVTINFTNNTGSGTGHGTFSVSKVTLVEGPSGTTCSVTKEITNGTLSGPTSVVENGTFNGTLTPADGYELPTSLESVTIGSEVLTEDTDYTYNNSTGAISIPNIDDVVVITAVCNALPVKTYNLFSDDIEEGDYLIVYNGMAMNTTPDATPRLQYETVTPSEGAITTYRTNIVWHIAPSGNYWTMKCGTLYAVSTQIKNQATTSDSGSTDNAKWTITHNSSSYQFENLARSKGSDSSNKWLRANGSYGFACYGSGTGGALSLYKLPELKVEITTEADKDKVLIGSTHAITLSEKLSNYEGSSHAAFTTTNSDKINLTDNGDGTASVYGKATGSATVTATLEGKTGTISLTVVRTLTGIVVSGTFETTYIEGDSFDPTGMVVTASFTGDTDKVISSGNYTYSPSGELGTSDDKITVTYVENGIEKTADVEITVNAVQKEIDHISWTAPSTQHYDNESLTSANVAAFAVKAYWKGEEDPTDVSLGTYSLHLGDTEIKASDLPRDWTKSDNGKVLKVSYKEKELSVTVEVIEHLNAITYEQLGEDTEATLTCSDFSGTSTELNYSSNGLTVVISQGSSNTSYGNFSIFKNKTLTISAGSVKSISLTCTATGDSQYGPGSFGEGAPDGYTYEAEGYSGSWTGSSKSVVFTATNNQVRITELVVVYQNETTVHCENTDFVAQKKALQFVDYFNTELDKVCNDSGSEGISTTWADLASKYTETYRATSGNTSAFDNLFKYAVASERNPETGLTPEGDSLQKALARYDWIVSHHSGLSDFINSTSGRGAVQSGRIAIFDAFGSNSETATLIIIVASIVSLTAIGGYFLFKKKKQY